jgi:exodeoxyribonuclease-5
MASLTEHQQAAFDAVYERLAGGAAYTTLRGYAGTGKTFLAGALVDRMLDEGAALTACAPTHKAAQVLRTHMNEHAVPTQTLHSFLGLRLVPDDKGAYALEPEGDLAEYPAGIVVVDEASMIGAAEWAHIEQAPRRLQWLFVGDPAQLPPVNETASPVFDVEGPLLEEVHRQGEGNPILALARHVRLQKSDPFTSRFANDEGVAVTDNAGEFEASARRAFQSDAFDDDATAARVLAYRNKTVRRYNRAIRDALYGEDAPQFVKGEWLVARETWFHNNVPTLKNSEEVRVRKARVETFEADDLSTWTVWRLKVRSVHDAWTRALYVLHEDERERFENELEVRRKEAIEQPRAWSTFYDLKERFAEVDYAYASTVHQAQGSTFDTAFVDVRDLRACRGPERQALLYVAVTRPSRRLALLV